MKYWFVANTISAKYYVAVAVFVVNRVTHGEHILLCHEHSEYCFMMNASHSVSLVVMLHGGHMCCFVVSTVTARYGLYVSHHF